MGGDRGLIWGALLHLSYNMWGDRHVPGRGEDWAGKPYLRFDAELWRALLERMQAAGMNLVVIDLGDAVRYESHPEIAVQGALSIRELRAELAEARRRGIEPIPKLNFSTCHDLWLGEYARCVSTPRYYAVCADLIAEAIDLFDRPRLFHLGMDEETAGHQRDFAYAVMRQHELWWHDLAFLLEQVERKGVRPWVWSDYAWTHPEYFERMPRSVLQSNWYYGRTFGRDAEYVRTYHELEAHGYDQVPTASTWSDPDNFELTVAYCREAIAPERLAGFLQTAWHPTLPAHRDAHLAAIERVERAKARWPGGPGG